jgi:hypothetical protein
MAGLVLGAVAAWPSAVFWVLVALLSVVVHSAVLPSVVFWALVALLSVVVALLLLGELASR